MLTKRSHEWFDVPYSVTASIGLAMMLPGHFEPMDVINRADEALYVAKTSGRNRVMRWQDKPADGESAGSSAPQAAAATAASQSHGSEIAKPDDGAVLETTAAQDDVQAAVLRRRRCLPGSKLRSTAPNSPFSSTTAFRP